MFKGFVDNRAACRTKCDNNDKCVSFEWWGEANYHPDEGYGYNYCQLSSSCTYSHSVESSEVVGSNDDGDIYVKDNSESNYNDMK